MQRFFSLRPLAAVVATSCLGAAAYAQFTSQNISLLSNRTPAQFNTTAGSSCWGYTSPSGREYAIIGGFNRSAYYDVTNPTSPVLIGTIPHTASDWNEMKVYQDFAYVVSEGSGTGIQVVDLRQADQGQVTLLRTITNPGRTHNVVIDTYSGFLYTCGSNEGDATTMIFSLADPTNPVKVGQWTEAYQHDAQVVTYTSGPLAGRQIFFGYSEGRGIDIIDVTNKANPFRISRTPYPNIAYGHQGWLSEDRRYIYVDDELDEQRFGNQTRSLIFDVSNLSAPQLVTTFTNGLAAIDHNQYVRGNYLYQANYRSGLRVYDISNPIAPVEVGWFDTYPGSDSAQFNGAWNNYPFLPSGNVIVSDIERGMFVLDVSQITTSVGFTYPNNKPAILDPDGGTPIRVQLNLRNVTPQAVELKWTTGTVINSVPMTSVGTNLYEAVFPAIVCGARVSYYIEVTGTNGKKYSDPSTQLNQPSIAVSQDGRITNFSDTFDTNLGWTVTNSGVTDGAWARGIPAGNGGARSDPPAAFGGSGACYVTGNNFNGDLDGGTTTLTSPVINLAGTGEYYVKYARWFQNTQADDNFIVQVSNNGGTSWSTLETVTESAAWTLKEFRIADVIPTTANMRFRFVAADLGNPSLYEAAVDSFEVTKIECVTPVISGRVNLEDFNGNVTQETARFELIQNGNVVDERVLTLGANGAYSFTTNVRGPVEIAVKPTHWLRKKINGLTLTDTGLANLNFSVINGDVDLDNSITIFDYIDLSDAFDKVENSTGWNGNADLDGDGAVTIFDYIILSTNFDITGD